MRPNAISSKSGRESGSSARRASEAEHRVCSRPIDGRATLADVAQKSGNESTPSFQRLIVQLYKDGFIREVSSGAGAGPAAGAAKPRASPIRPSIWISARSLRRRRPIPRAQPTRPPRLRRHRKRLRRHGLPRRPPSAGEGAGSLALHRARQEAEEKRRPSASASAPKPRPSARRDRSQAARRGREKAA